MPMSINAKTIDLDAVSSRGSKKSYKLKPAHHAFNSLEFSVSTHLIFQLLPATIQVFHF